MRIYKQIIIKIGPYDSFSKIQFAGKLLSIPNAKICFYFTTSVNLVKGDNGAKSIELAYTLLEQTFQGTIPNPQILSYLKYSIRSQLITCSGVFSALTSFKKINQQVLHCLLLIGKSYTLGPPI